MTVRTRWEIGWWAAAVGCGVWGTARWYGADVERTGMPPTPALAAPDAALAADSAHADSVAAALDYVDAHDPFSPDRASVEQRAALSPVAPPALPPGPQLPEKVRPAFVLRGVVGVAPDLRAILDGLPDVEGSVLLAVGDTARGFRVRRVWADSVVVQGADTAWRLGVRRQWP